MRTLVKSLIISSTALLAAVACAPSGGGGPGSSQPEGEPASYDRRVPRSEANAVTAQTELLCNGTCPQALAISLARVDRAKSTLFQQCTAFLVAEDIVATNAHCVPEDIHAARAACAGRMSFHFGSPSETIACDRILSVTQESKSNLQPDLAFIRLARSVKRTPLRLSRMGLSDEAKLTVLSVDPAVVNGRHVGRLRVHTCIAKQGSLLTPQFTNDFGNVATMACEMKLGNSGSPLLAADGTIRGVLHGFRTGTARTYKGFKLPPSFNPLAFATNVACVNAPLFESEPPSACAVPPVKREDFVRRLEASTQVDLDRPFAEWSRTSAPKLFSFANDDISSSGRKAAIPNFRCVNALESWLEKSAADLGLDSLTRNGDKVAMTFTLPLWGVQPSLDASERVSMAVAEIDRATTTLSFDLAKARRDGFIHFTKTFTSETGRLKVRSATLDLPYCR